MPHAHGQRSRLISPACAVVRQTAFTGRTASAVITYNLSRLLQRVVSDRTMRFLHDAVISIGNNESVPNPPCVADRLRLARQRSLKTKFKYAVYSFLRQVCVLATRYINGSTQVDIGHHRT